jgi:hypothetical protein
MLWVQRAYEHGVFPLLAVYLEKVSAADVLRLMRLRLAAEHLRTMADLRFVAHSLHVAGIDWLVFKGPVLSNVIFQRPRARGYSDLDLLVQAADLDRAVQVLVHGGSHVAPGEGIDVMHRLGYSQVLLVLPQGTLLDLHWHVINDAKSRTQFFITTNALFTESRDIELGGVPCKTFGAIDTVLHLSMHGCMDGGDQLRHLLDLQQALKRDHVAADGLLERARSFGLELIHRLMENRTATFVDPGIRLDLPAPSQLMRSWLALDALAMRRFPPGSRFEGRPSGGTVPLSTRARPAESWASFVKRVSAAARDRSRRGRE